MTDLVIDSSAVILALHDSLSLEAYGAYQLAAPPLLWSEVRSVLHAGRWREQISEDTTLALRASFQRARIARRAPRALDDEAWRVADELGWAKTYDAEFVALARLMGCRMVTADARLWRGAARLGFVVGPTEL